MTFVAFANPPSGQSPKMLRVVFAAAVFGRGTLWCFAEVLLAYHLHVRLALSSGQTASLLVALLLVSALGDVLGGWALRRFGGTIAAAVALQRNGAILSAFSLMLLFLPIGGFVWALFWGAAFRLAFGIYALPQTALLSLLPPQLGATFNLVAVNSIAGSAARLLVAVLAICIVGSVSATSPYLESTSCALVASGAILSAFVLARSLGHGEMPAPLTIQLDLRDALAGEFGWLAFAFLAHAGALFTISRLLLFTPPTQTWPAPGGWMVLAFTIGMTLGPWLAIKVLPVIGEADFSLSMLVITVSAIPIVLLNLAIEARMAAALAHGAALGASGYMLWQALADTVRQRAVRSPGIEGPAYAAIALTTKIGIALGSGALGFLIDGYEQAHTPASVAIVAMTGLGAGLCLWAWFKGPQTAFLSQRRLKLAAILHEEIGIERETSCADRAGERTMG